MPKAPMSPGTSATGSCSARSGGALWWRTAGCAGSGPGSRLSTGLPPLTSIHRAAGGKLDCGDYRQRLLEQPDGEVVQVRAAGTADGRGVGEVSAGTEDATRAAQHDGAAAAVGGEFLARVGDLADQGNAEVVAGRPVDLQRGGVVGA